jgi:hypothetical protein
MYNCIFYYTFDANSWTICCRLDIFLVYSESFNSNSAISGLRNENWIHIRKIEVIWTISLFEDHRASTKIQTNGAILEAHEAARQYIWQGFKLEVLTRGKLIVFGHLQGKVCTPPKKFGLVSQQSNLRVAHPSPIAYQHYNSTNCSQYFMLGTLLICKLTLYFSV